MQINDLIFKELIKRGFKSEGSSKVYDIADSKLWYLIPEQAQGFLDLEQGKEYKSSIFDQEIQLLKEHLMRISKSLSTSFNIVDLGCGDGIKAITILNMFKEKGNIRYCPIDISAYMVNKAAERIRRLRLGKVLEFKWNISDFENLVNIMPLISDSKFNKNLLLLLGNTFGNFDRQDILSSIAKCMKKEDILVLGNSLRSNDENEIIKPYKNSLLDSFLLLVISQIGLGKKDVRYEPRFRNSRVEMTYRLLKDKSVSHLGKTVHFKKGDIIIVCISLRYSEKELIEALQQFFKRVYIYTNPEKTYALAACFEAKGI